MIVAVLAMLVAGLSVATPSPASPTPAAEKDKIRPALVAKFQDKAEVPFWVRFTDKPDLTGETKVKGWAGRGRAVHDALTATARASQANTRGLLNAANVDFTPFWASNAIYVKQGTLKLARLLAADTEVSALLPTTTYKLPEPAEAEPQATVDTVEWNVAAIHADQVWSQFGDTGSGIVVANIDTGVDYTHPALVAQYRGNTGNGFNHNYNWYDPSAVCPQAEPCDNHGHGTHTMGTMVGNDGAGNQIGVAPGARWIAAKGCESASCSDFAILASGQWMLAPTDTAGKNPRPDLRPNIVNNSWGDAPDLPFYDDVLTAWRAAGIFPAFSNGNSGSGCDTAGSPGDRPLAYSTGAFGASGSIAGFSSRGPGAGDDIKPNIAAPGVSVRSSIPTNDYQVFSGTSMAAPHLAATVALIWSAAPSLVGDVSGTEALLDQSAVDVDDTRCGGTAADNNVYGEGRLDALAAVAAAPRAPSGTLTGTLTDAASGDPVSGIVTAESGTIARSAFPGTDGAYSLQAPPGDYTITASAFSYRGESATRTVTADQTTTVDFALEPLPAFAVRGTVTDSATSKPITGAVVSVPGTPLSATTDTLGQYRFARVPTGDYTLAVTPDVADNCYQRSEQPISIDQDTVQDVQVGHARDPYGYTCGYESTQYIEADDTILPFKVQEARQEVQVTLPFPVYLYEREYRSTMAFVTSTGQVNFTQAGNNTSSPGITAWAFPFYDGHLKVNPDTRVATETKGTSPNRTFTVELRNIGHQLDPSFEIDAEVTFHENGDIVFAYRDIDPDNAFEQGSGVWAVIAEPYADYTHRFLYASNGEATLNNTRQIRYTPPARGLLTGRVTDTNDRQPIANAPIRITDQQGNPAVRHVLTDKNGRYVVPLRLGDYTIRPTPYGYQPQTTRVSIKKDKQSKVVDAALSTGVISTNDDSISIDADTNGDGEATLRLRNTGNTPLNWRIAEVGGGSAPPAGDKLGSFSPGELWVATGVARRADGNLWVSGFQIGRQAGPATIRSYQPDGTPTGTEYDAETRWGLPESKKIYDLVDVPAADLVCGMAQGGFGSEQTVGTIYCFDPATGDLRQKLDLGRLAHDPVGLAYDGANDVFYVTGTTPAGEVGRFTGGVTTVAGLTRPNKGEILAECPIDFQAGGAAYNPISRTLWVGGDANPYTEGFDGGFWMHQVEPGTCRSVSRFHYAGDWSTGVDLEADGNLWFSSLNEFAVLHYSADDPVGADAPWLSLSQADGVLKPGQSVTITATAALPEGTDSETATLRILGNAGRDWDVRIPVTVSRSD